MKMVTKNKLLAIFLIYGIVMGFVSLWWWNNSDSILFLNIPGMLLAEKVYSVSIELLGDPASGQAHFSIPWLLRIPQVCVPVSILFWGLLGSAVQVTTNALSRKTMPPKI